MSDVPDLVLSAPGKLIIAGEYAVLEGHPALVTAVSRRAICRFTPGDELTVRARGGPLEHARALPVVLEGSHVLIDGDDGSYALFSAVLEEALARGLPLPRGEVSVDTSAFYAGSQKLGLGSSAAAATALAALLLSGSRSAHGHELDRERLRRLATATHDRFSAPARGSGVDVAASSHGGTLRFQKERGGSVRISPSRLCPRGLRLLVPFAGASASTRELVSGVRRFAARDARAYAGALEDIAYATLELLGAVGPDEDPRVFLAAVDRCRRSLQRLGDKAAIDIVSKPHLEIARLARAFGGAAKPSGAGGGDVAVCFVPEAAADECVAAFGEAGFSVIDLEAGDAGAHRA